MKKWFLGNIAGSAIGGLFGFMAGHFAPMFFLKASEGHFLTALLGGLAGIVLGFVTGGDIEAKLHGSHARLTIRTWIQTACASTLGKYFIPALLGIGLIFSQVRIVLPLLSSHFIATRPDRGHETFVSLSTLFLTGLLFSTASGWLFPQRGRTILSMLGGILGLSVLFGFLGIRGFFDPAVGWVLISIWISIVNLPAIITGVFLGSGLCKRGIA